MQTYKLIPTNSQSTSIESRNILERSGKKNSYRSEIYEFIKHKGGATCDEVEVALELRHQTASCFIRFLTQDGLLCDSGLKRLTRSGRMAIVWKAIKPVEIFADDIGQLEMRF